MKLNRESQAAIEKMMIYRFCICPAHRVAVATLHLVNQTDLPRPSPPRVGFVLSLELYIVRFSGEMFLMCSTRSNLFVLCGTFIKALYVMKVGGIWLGHSLVDIFVLDKTASAVDSSQLESNLLLSYWLFTSIDLLFVVFRYFYFVSLTRNFPLR